MPTCASRPGSSSRTSSPGSPADRRWSPRGSPALDTVLVLHDAARIGDPPGDLGDHQRQPGARRHPGDRRRDRRHLLARRGARPRPADRRRRSPATSLRCTRRPSRRARSIAMRPVAHRFDVVLTTGSGYPLDQNLYQAVKGMSAAYQIVRRGGTIVCAAECRDGFPDHGSYRAELTARAEPAPSCWPTSSSGRRTVPDQWQLQIQARIQTHAEVVMHTVLPHRRRRWPRPTSSRPATSRQGFGTPSVTPAPTRRSACFPRARRPSRTSRPSATVDLRTSAEGDSRCCDRRACTRRWPRDRSSPRRGGRAARRTGPAGRRRGRRRAAGRGRRARRRTRRRR